MHDLKYIRDNFDILKKKCQKETVLLILISLLT